MIIDDRIDDDDEEEESVEEKKEPTFAALGGRPRSVDFKRIPIPQHHQHQQQSRQRRGAGPDEDKYFVVHMSHVYKREAQEMTDVETTRVIQVHG